MVCTKIHIVLASQPSSVHLATIFQFLDVVSSVLGPKSSSVAYKGVAYKKNYILRETYLLYLLRIIILKIIILKVIYT